ncbi:MAG: hypothetical protein RRC07_04275 [Anaerolineae bacterium]|nr:hypothetical protein [Anaerolineae bacterium]
MRDRNRLRNILAAGLLTGLVLATIVAFGWQEVRGSDRAPASSTNEESLRSENEQLRQALDVMQQREASYQTELEAANQTIEALQSPAVTSAGRRYDDDDDEEYEEHEEYEHEDDDHDDDDDDGWWDND